MSKPRRRRSKSAKSEVSTRLRALPRELLLALLNGTAILVIAASILAIVASSKVTHLAQNVASTMTDAVLSRIGEDPKQVMGTLQDVSGEVRTVLSALERRKADGPGPVGTEIARLNERLESLEANIAQLRDARSRLIDEAIAKIGASLGEGLRTLRPCPDGEGVAMQPVVNEVRESRAHPPVSNPG